MLNKTQINAINRLWKGKDFYNPSPEYLQYNYIPVFQHLDGHNIPFKVFTNGISLYAVYDEKNELPFKCCSEEHSVNDGVINRMISQIEEELNRKRLYITTISEQELNCFIKSEKAQGNKHMIYMINYTMDNKKQTVCLNPILLREMLRVTRQSSAILEISAPNESVKINGNDIIAILFPLRPLKK